MKPWILPENPEGECLDFFWIVIKWNHQLKTVFCVYSGLSDSFFVCLFFADLKHVSMQNMQKTKNPNKQKKKPILLF